jgi:hypothetical protein
MEVIYYTDKKMLVNQEMLTKEATLTNLLSTN